MADGPALSRSANLYEAFLAGRSPNTRDAYARDVAHFAFADEADIGHLTRWANVGNRGILGLPAAEGRGVDRRMFKPLADADAFARDRLLFQQCPDFIHGRVTRQTG